MNMSIIASDALATNLSKLEQWYEQEKLNGLVDVKFAVNPDMKCTDAEELVGEILDMIEASNDPLRLTIIPNL